MTGIQVEVSIFLKTEYVFRLVEKIFKMKDNTFFTKLTF